MENSREFVHLLFSKAYKRVGIRSANGFDLNNRMAALGKSLELVLSAASEFLESETKELILGNSEVDAGKIQKLKLAIEDLKFPIPL